MIPVKSNLALMCFKHNRDGDQRSHRANIGMNANETTFVPLITRELVVCCVMVFRCFSAAPAETVMTERKNKGSKTWFSVKLR